MDHTSVWLTAAAVLAQPFCVFVSWYAFHKLEMAKPKKTPKVNFITLSPTIMVAYNSPNDYEVWDLEVSGNGYQTFSPYKDVTELCTDNVKRIISEEIIRREKIKTDHYRNAA